MRNEKYVFIAIIFLKIFTFKFLNINLILLKISDLLIN